jgi:hypothetical protein
MFIIEVDANGNYYITGWEYVIVAILAIMVFALIIKAIDNDDRKY